MYDDEARRLDATILRCIRDYAVDDFEALALRVFSHQLRYNEPYARYCAAFGVTIDRLPQAVAEIPPLPSAAFKEAAICTFDPSRAALAFETSGTTQGRGGMHYMETAALYDAALAAGFQRGMLYDVERPLRFLLLVPNPRERPTSSLGYMMQRCAQRFGDGRERWLLRGDELDVDGFIAAARSATHDASPVCVAATAFALLRLCEALIECRENVTLPAQSRVMETGGFKGRTRVVAREELYSTIESVLGVPAHRIIAEYGMTELTSQYYERVQSAEVRARWKYPPPWLRSRIVGADGSDVPPGTVGQIVHVDLANRSSCIAVQTEDLGLHGADGALMLIGRERGAELRGCSLDAEQLRTLQRV